MFPDINTGIVADGGAGTDTIALVSASAGADLNHLAGLSNFEILEVTDTLVNDVNLDAYEPANTINHVILDMGFSGFNTISGAEQNFQLDVMHQSSGELVIRVDNAFSNPNDTVNILLSGDTSGTNGFGTIDLNPLGLSAVEFVNLQSTQHTSLTGDTENDLQLEAPGIQTLAIQHNAGGDVSLNLNGSIFSNSLTMVDATGFTGGITENDGALGNQNITFHAPISGNDLLNFGNGNDTVTLGDGANNVILGNGNDTVTLGGGTNSVTIGSGTDSITAGDGNNTVTIANATSHLDTVTLGSGTNTVTLQGAGGSGSSISFAAHGANIDTVNFNNVAESGLSTPDTITGFQSATDILHFNAAMFSGAPIDFFTVTSDAAVLTVIGADTGTGHDTFAYNSTTGHLFIDVSHTGASEMEIILVGMPALTQAHTLVS